MYSCDNSLCVDEKEVKNQRFEEGNIGEVSNNNKNVISVYRFRKMKMKERNGNFNEYSESKYKS